MIKPPRLVTCLEAIQFPRHKAMFVCARLDLPELPLYIDTNFDFEDVRAEFLKNIRRDDDVGLDDLHLTKIIQYMNALEQCNKSSLLHPDLAGTYRRHMVEDIHRLHYHYRRYYRHISEFSKDYVFTLERKERSTSVGYVNRHTRAWTDVT